MKQIVTSLFVLLAIVTLRLGSLPVAEASFPGTNGKIVFERDLGGDMEIYTMNPDGSDVTQITNNTADDRYSAVSADGSKIVFASNRDGNFEIYTMNFDGTNQTRLTTNTALDQVPSWSPDGTKIAFVSELDGDLEVWTMNADGTNQTQLTFNTIEDSNVAWSPDGTKIAFDRDVHGPSEIWVMDTDGSNQTQLTNFSSTQDVDPNWSPDGTKLLWRRDPGGVGGGADIWVMNNDGSSPTNLTASNGYDSGGTYSPDGTKVVFMSTVDDPNFELYVMDADGTNRIRLTTNTIYEGIHDWQPAVVTFNFTGFFQPVDNLPTLNSVKAGSAIPIKFSLTGFQGFDIFAADYPKSQDIPCSSNVLVDGIEETTTAGTSSLSYDSILDQYVYVWKTEKSWAGTCRQLVVKLTDGTFHRANFQLK